MKVGEFIEESLKAGKRKDEIKKSLLKRGIDKETAERALDYHAKAKKTKILYYFIIIVLAVLLIVLSYLFFYKPQKILKEEKPQPISKFEINYSAFNHRISLYLFDFPDTAHQLENITARFYWSSIVPVDYEGMPALFFIDQDGDILYRKALYDQDQYSTLGFVPNHTYKQTYTFNIPPIPAGRYSINYTLAHRDSFELSQTFDGRATFFLKNITIMENASLYPCGLIVGWVRNGSSADKAGLSAGDEIIEINGKKPSDKNTYKSLVKGILLEDGEFVPHTIQKRFIKTIYNTYSLRPYIRGNKSLSFDLKICSNAAAP